jgi:DNA gyrase subunit A
MLEPVILPTSIPNLLINGSSGIAVGMATNIPPHNLSEVCDAIVRLIERPEATLDELIKIIPGPDFPTAGFIIYSKGIREAYETGRGVIRVRARAFVEKQAQNRERIIISEIPYQINKSKLLERIAELVKEKKIDGITDIRDESDRDGMRVVLEIRRDATALVILNRLYKYTQMEVSFGIILLAIVNGRPHVLTLKEILQNFLIHRKDIIIRRTTYELRQAQARAHILEGLKIALDFMDDVIEVIRSSSDPKEARARLMSDFSLTEIQAQAILDMRLQRLTGMEREKITSEYEELLKNMERFRAILASPAMVLQLIREELELIKKEHGDERRTEILAESGEIDVEDLIAEEDMVVTISHDGYIKRSPVSLYRAQRRGGKGMTGVKPKEEDFVEMLFVASSHDHLLFFTNKGRVYWKKVHEVPEASRASRGKAIVNLLELQQGEQVTTTLSIRDFIEDKYVVMATKQGLVKKTELVSYSHPRTGGIMGIRLNEDDELISVRVSSGSQDIFLTTRQGKSIRFHESEIREMGRVTAGNIGIRMDKDDEVVGMEALDEGASILTVTENGYGKRTKTDEYKKQGRGGRGILTIKTSERNGPVVYAYQVSDVDQLMIITGSGKIIRLRASDIKVIGRNTQGVRLINLAEGEKVVGVAKVVED